MYDDVTRYYHQHTAGLTLAHALAYYTEMMRRRAGEWAKKKISYHGT